MAKQIELILLLKISQTYQKTDRQDQLGDVSQILKKLTNSY
ncbi:hypothetical protein [Liquorilactobacillus ghanensis]|jgi:hypothetical protein|nr:hypothetical protein [Liquorilactobacillus ghanensis]